jgi:ribosome-associated protein
MKELEQLVSELVTLPSQALHQSSLPEAIKPLLKDAAKMKGSVRQRQVKYLTKLLQEHPVEELYELVGRHRGSTLAAQKQLHTLEFYRDALISEALDQQRSCAQNGMEWTENWVSSTLNELRSELPDIDSLALCRLAYLFVQTRNPRYSREIFRYLRSVHDMQQRNNNRAAESESHN